MSFAQMPGAAPPLNVVRVAEVEPVAAEQRWLVDRLWVDEAVGVIGGAPKCCKTWLALDLAVSVASGTPALGLYGVREPGPVIMYGAEDSPAHLRSRVENLASIRGLELGTLDVHLIVTPALRLDDLDDLARLDATLGRYRPRLLILDPLVRLHRAHENSAGTMSSILGELRELQRRHHVGIALVHHLRKKAIGREADGQALRGSGDLHAWGDSNLYLRRRGPGLLLSIEHRSDAAPSPATIELATTPLPHLRCVDDEAEEEVPDVKAQILAVLAGADGPISREELRGQLRVRNARLGDALRALREAGLVEQVSGGIVLRMDLGHRGPVPST